MIARLRDEVAWEYLDDGGVLFCQMCEGAYWQLGPPAGTLLTCILSADAEAAPAQVAEILRLTAAEASAAVEAFRETLLVLALLDASDMRGDVGGASSRRRPGGTRAARVSGSLRDPESRWNCAITSGR